MARFRTTIDDFEVEEVALEQPSGNGNHLWIWVEKRGESTEYLARGIARALDVDPSEVGYAGRKDRWAVTRQWFCLPPGTTIEAARALELEGADILDAAFHPRRLRTGQLAGNRFSIVVRELAPDALERAQLGASRLVRVGLPNRYGTQRFGRRGDNADGGRRLLAGERVTGDQRDARFLLSALQSEVFNQVLATRPWGIDELVEGDVAFEHGSEALSLVRDPTRFAPSLQTFEISPSGPIFGPHCRPAAGAVAALERAALEACGVDPDPRSWRLRRGLKVPGSRRPLRVAVTDLALEAIGPDAARVRVQLPAGAYVTVLLEELFGSLEEGPRDRPEIGTDQDS